MGVFSSLGKNSSSFLFEIWVWSLSMKTELLCLFLRTKGHFNQVSEEKIPKIIALCHFIKTVVWIFMFNELCNCVDTIYVQNSDLDCTKS